MNTRAAIHSFPVSPTPVKAPKSPKLKVLVPTPSVSAMPSPAQFAAVTDLIKAVFNVPAVSVTLHGAPCEAEGGAYRSFLEIPLSDGGEVIGALRVLDTELREFTDRDCMLLEGFARLVVEQVVLWSEASRDMLTNAMTRRAFMDTLRKTFAARQRTGSKNALAIFDLDHFKSINDTWGHTAGDAVLHTVARLVMRELRTEDCFGRLGGEEFGVILANADGEDAAEVSERIRRAIELAVIPGYEDIRISASFGVADLTDLTVSADAWVTTADAQLYRAKDEGRNSVCVATETSAAPLLN
ncbi:sensor domain-containing diguanylate cyclase [Pararhodobacter sp.]|jgi:diguanylate cyclase (GGDEF)-like protein|uniref:sensor domain-containing diguanylate cyclase n=1 Tax=Pararhodobacter sp. TaxID=2127056 RepID=UPI002FDD75CB